MRQNFFTYGAFSQGKVHYPKYSQLIQNSEKASVRGEVYRLRSGYPLIELNPEGLRIQGSLCELTVTESFWSILDELLGFDSMRPEKSLFLRQTVQVEREDGTLIEAQIYGLNPKKVTSTDKKITNGDWHQDLLDRPPLVEQLADRHREYIFKLSKCKGRDIVPIKLDMYRELMSLEMIVDKGRRLALTSLGLETSLFLS